MSMNSFLCKFKSNIAGVLSGFDRLIFHGGIRSLIYEVGMAAHLYSRGVYLKDFKDYTPIVINCTLRHDNNDIMGFSIIQ